MILAREIVSEAPFAKVVLERSPHQFEGHSVFEDVRDVQRVKTAVLRGILNNTYSVNQPRPVVDSGAVSTPEDVLNWVPGKPIRLRAGYAPQQAISWTSVPSIVGATMPMLDYMDGVAAQRTGITGASAGIDPEAFQNTSATSAMLMSEEGIAQADAIVRQVASCLRKPFLGLLKLVIAHAERGRHLRIRGQWVPYDPRLWHAASDCTINIGLGGGTKERDMAVLQIILGLQRELIAAMGPMNPYVKPDQLYNTLAKITETAGFKSPDMYFTQPDPQEVQALMQAGQGKPSAEEMKIQLEQAKAAANVEKEQAQAQADMAVQAQAAQIRQQEAAAKIQFQREKMAMELRLKALETALQYGIPPQVMEAELAGFNV